jgi:hypothetical protein
MTKLFLPMFLLLSLASFAQTTYTTTANACSGKINQMCTLPVEDQNHVGSCVIIDNRSPSRIGYMDLSCTFGRTSITESTQASQRIRMAPGARSTEWPTMSQMTGRYTPL